MDGQLPDEHDGNHVVGDSRVDADTPSMGRNKGSRGVGRIGGDGRESGRRSREIVQPQRIQACRGDSQDAPDEETDEGNDQREFQCRLTTFRVARSHGR